MKTEKTHAQGAYMNESRLGVPIFSSLCGLANTLTGHVVECRRSDAWRVTCERCKTANSFNQDKKELK